MRTVFDREWELRCETCDQVLVRWLGPCPFDPDSLLLDCHSEGHKIILKCKEHEQ